MKVQIVRFDLQSRSLQKLEDNVAEEKPLHIIINNRHYATILCTPQDMKELTLGHLLSEGIIKSVEEIAAISLEKAGICRVALKSNVNVKARIRLSGFSRMIFSACGGAYPSTSIKQVKKITSPLVVKAEVIHKSVSALNQMAETFRGTGGVHSAAIYNGEGVLLAFAEDVGRHNAVDKVIGFCALEGVNLSRCLLALSGRLSGDIVLKAVRMGIPVVASLSAALASGVETAREANLTLIGFVRGKRMNIYSSPERILLS